MKQDLEEIRETEDKEKKERLKLKLQELKEKMRKQKENLEEKIKKILEKLYENKKIDVNNDSQEKILKKVIKKLDLTLDDTDKEKATTVIYNWALDKSIQESAMEFVESESEEEEVEEEAEEEDEEEVEEEAEEEDEEEVEEEAEEEVEEEESEKQKILREWKRIYEEGEKEDKDIIQRITWNVCKGYNIERTMAHVFHYCINNKTYFQDTDKNILIKYLLTLDDYKQCDVKDLEESLDVVFKLYEDTMNREVPHSQFVEALKIYLNDLIYTDRYKYNLFTFISFKSHLDYILTPSYLGNDEKMTSLYIMMSDKLFYFNILYDVAEILYNNPNFWMFATTDKVIAALLKKDNVFSNIYKIMASNKDEDKKAEFTKEVNRIIDMLGSFDVKSITRPEIYNYMTEQALVRNSSIVFGWV